MNLNDIPQTITNLLVNDVDGEKIIIKPIDGKIANLNTTASAIFDLVDGNRSVQEIITTAQQLYHTTDPNTVANDTVELLLELKAKNIIA